MKRFLWVLLYLGILIAVWVVSYGQGYEAGELEMRRFLNWRLNSTAGSE